MAGTVDRQLPRRSKSQLANIKKVAVTMPGAQAQFLELDQERPLTAIIQDICANWNLVEPENYALQNSEGKQVYITEKNREEIQNGDVLSLAPSPGKTARQMVEKLRGGKNEDKVDALSKLSQLSNDSTFAEEFINCSGHQLLIGILTEGNYQKTPLANALKAFVALMDHGIVSWDILEAAFIRRVAENVNCSSSNQDSSCLQYALEILECVVLHSTGKQSVVDQIVTPTNIIPHLGSTNTDVQKNTIALINALFIKADGEKRRKIAETLHSKTMRNLITGNVIREKSKMGSEMAHQLYVLQVLVLNLHEDRMNAVADSHDSAVMRDIEELKRIAFEVEGDPNINTVRKSQNSVGNYRKLGFQHQNNPVEDFTKPGSLLALDNMLYFARNHGESYVKVVLENANRGDEHDCPFIQASIALTRILCEILNIGEQPTDEGQTYHSLFFCHDKPFEEFFCMCIQLLNKTWREMRASIQDFQKVLGVVKEQVTRALESQPSSFEGFRMRLNQLTFAEILKLWDMEKIRKEEWESQAKPIVELRKQITPEILELIKQQRFNFLMEGTRFSKNTGRGNKRSFWYWRLAPNKKALHYGDCGEAETPSLETLPNKLAIVDVRNLLVGRDAADVKDKGKSKPNAAHNLVFAIETGTMEQLKMLASTEHEYDMWTDGIHALLGKDMVSKQTEQDLETLLSMEIKLRLLDTEGITIPVEPPNVPPLPADFNFCYSP